MKNTDTSRKGRDSLVSGTVRINLNGVGEVVFMAPGELCEDGVRYMRGSAVLQVASFKMFCKVVRQEPEFKNKEDSDIRWLRKRWRRLLSKTRAQKSDGEFRFDCLETLRFRDTDGPISFRFIGGGVVRLDDGRKIIVEAHDKMDQDGYPTPVESWFYIDEHDNVVIPAGQHCRLVKDRSFPQAIDYTECTSVCFTTTADRMAMRMKNRLTHNPIARHLRFDFADKDRPPEKKKHRKKRKSPTSHVA